MLKTPSETYIEMNYARGCYYIEEIWDRTGYGMSAASEFLYSFQGSMHRLQEI